MIEKFQALGMTIILSLSAGLLVFFYGYKGPDYSIGGVIPDVILTVFFSMVIGGTISWPFKRVSNHYWGPVITLLAALSIAIFMIVYLNMDGLPRQAIISAPMPYTIGLIVSLFELFRRKFKYGH